MATFPSIEACFNPEMDILLRMYTMRIWMLIYDDGILGWQSFFSFHDVNVHPLACVVLLVFFQQ